MGSYRQHVGFAATLGVGYAWGAYALAGVHWVYGSVAALATTLGGLLPDLDSESAVQLKGFTGILGVLAGVAAWQATAGAAADAGLGVGPEPWPFELRIWGAVVAFVVVRHGLRRVVARLTVHRGMVHSLPVCGIVGALVYLHYPSPHHPIRLLMAAAVMVGFASHLLLDEICSVDLRGIRVNKAFGTALKFWSGSIPATLLAYLILSYLAWRVAEVWPDGPPRLDRAVVRPAMPQLPEMPKPGRVRRTGS